MYNFVCFWKVLAYKFCRWHKLNLYTNLTYDFFLHIVQIPPSPGFRWKKVLKKSTGEKVKNSYVNDLPLNLSFHVCFRRVLSYIHICIYKIQIFIITQVKYYKLK